MYHIVSYPKAGRTWLRLMVARFLQVQHGLNATPDELLSGKAFRTVKIPRISFTHDADEKFTAWNGKADDIRVTGQYTDVVLLVRDPRDIMVSGYFHKVNREKRCRHALALFRPHFYGYFGRGITQDVKTEGILLFHSFE